LSGAQGGGGRPRDGRRWATISEEPRRRKSGSAAAWVALGMILQLGNNDGKVKASLPTYRSPVGADGGSPLGVALSADAVEQWEAEQMVMRGAR
jgi:hypothetical protein